jgi:hypothetical protein
MYYINGRALSRPVITSPDKKLTEGKLKIEIIPSLYEDNAEYMDLNKAIESLDDTEFRHSLDENDDISQDDYTSRGDSSNNLGGTTPSKSRTPLNHQ